MLIVKLADIIHPAFIVHSPLLVAVAMNNKQQTTNIELLISLALLGHILRYCAKPAGSAHRQTSAAILYQILRRCSTNI
jgi:hypothetical protein